MTNSTLQTLKADFNIGIRPHVVEPLRNALKKAAPSLELDAERGHWPTWPARVKRREDLIRVSVRIEDVREIGLIRTALMTANFDPSVKMGDVFYYHVLTDYSENDKIIKIDEARSED